MTVTATGAGAGAVPVPAHGARVDVDGLEFAYGSLQVLFGVSFSVAAGESLAMLGTNGAGKSTVLRVLSGLARPTAGHVHVDGCEVTGADVTSMAERGVVLVPGGRAVFPDMTVLENLEIGGYMRRREGSRRRERLAYVCDLFPELGQHFRQQAGTLSGGQQQQLALAKAFLLEPRVLCIDELSLGLAPVVVADLLRTLEIIRAAGTTLIIVEQSLNVAASICERAIFLEKGSVRFEGRTAELQERDDIARAVFLGGAERQVSR